MSNQKIHIPESEFVEKLLQKGKELFVTEDINQLFFNGKARPKQLNNFLFSMSQRGWIKSIEKGKYTLLKVSGDLHNNSFIIGMQLVQPACIGYWSALNYYGLTEQLPHTVFVQTTKRKKSKTVSGIDYRFVTLSDWKYFGTRKEWLREGEIRHLFFIITNLEKTIVDCFDYPRYCGGIIESVKGLISAKECDLEKLYRYAIRMKNSAILKRIGFIAELFEITYLSEKILSNKKLLSVKYSLLDTLASDYGKYNRKWRLRINTDVENLKRVLDV